MVYPNRQTTLLPFAVLVFTTFIFFFFYPFAAADDNNNSNNNNNNDNTGTPSSNPSGSYKGSFSKVCAFGDSYTDTGNARLSGGLSSFTGVLMKNSPYGSSIANSGIRKRLSDGKLIIDYVCDALSLPPLPPYKDTSLDISHGVNFAVAGSTALSTEYYLNNKVGQALVWKEVPVTVQTQMNWFNKYLLATECNGTSHQECKTRLQSLLFWVGELALYDYSRTYGSSVSVKWLTDLSVAVTYRLVKTLVERGAKYIVVQGLPPTGCMPFDISLSPEDDQDSTGCAQNANSLIQSHNELLQEKIAEVQKQYPDTMVVYADIWNAYYAILKSPSKFGFTEPLKACCGGGGGAMNFDLRSLCGTRGTTVCTDPAKYISWDGLHPTDAMNHVLADLLLNKGYCKPSFDQLVVKKRSSSSTT